MTNNEYANYNAAHKALCNNDFESVSELLFNAQYNDPFSDWVEHKGKIIDKHTGEVIINAVNVKQVIEKNIAEQIEKAFK